MGRKRPHLFLPPSPRCSPPLLSAATDGGEDLVIDLILFLQRVRKCIAVLRLLQCKKLSAKTVQAFQQWPKLFGIAVLQSREQYVACETLTSLPGMRSQQIFLLGCETQAQCLRAISCILSSYDIFVLHSFVHDHHLCRSAGESVFANKKSESQRLLFNSRFY